MKRPYYIAAPSYTERSGGVIALHHLCSALNSIGEKAYLAPMDMPFELSPYPNAPMLTPDIHSRQEREPICIYPDLIKGNPCNAKHVVWYLQSYPGTFGGEADFPEQDMIWSYSKPIADKTRSPNVMSIPTIDTNVWKLGNFEHSFKRKGACFYSNKYERVPGNKLLPITDGAIRLTGAREFMIETLQRSEICYVYENSAASVEAALCGCPVVLIRTPFFQESWLHNVYGWAGVKWSDEDGFRKDISLALANYNAMCSRFMNEELPRFVRKTQEWANKAIDMARDIKIA